MVAGIGVLAAPIAVLGIGGYELKLARKRKKNDQIEKEGTSTKGYKNKI